MCLWAWTNFLLGRINELKGEIKRGFPTFILYELHIPTLVHLESLWALQPKEVHVPTFTMVIT